MKNSRCDGEHCKLADGEVRLLPTGGSGNAILCYSCFAHEMDFREERNAEEGNMSAALPTWHSLQVYAPAENHLSDDQSVMTIKRKIGRWGV